MSGRIATVMNRRPAKPTSSPHSTGIFSLRARSRLGKSSPNGGGNCAIGSHGMAAFDAMRQRMTGTEIGAAIGAVLRIAGGEAMPIVRHFADQPAHSAGEDIGQTLLQPLVEVGGKFDPELLGTLAGGWGE